MQSLNNSGWGCLARVGWRDEGIKFKNFLTCFSWFSTLILFHFVGSMRKLSKPAASLYFPKPCNDLTFSVWNSSIHSNSSYFFRHFYFSKLFFSGACALTQADLHRIYPQYLVLADQTEWQIRKVKLYNFWKTTSEITEQDYPKCELTKHTSH